MHTVIEARRQSAKECSSVYAVAGKDANGFDGGDKQTSRDKN